MSNYFSRNLDLLNAVVKRAGMGLTRDFSELTQLQSAPKGHEEFTQAAYERTLAIMKIELGKYHADYPIVTEVKNMPFGECFVVNPLDGRINFMRSIPYFAVTVAVVRRSQVLSAVIYNPATGDTYFCEKGTGAFKEAARNNLRLRVAVRNDLSRSLIACQGDKWNDKVGEVRNFGSTSLDLAAVASGQLDGLVGYKKSLAEMAAGSLLVREAGGRCLSINQEDNRSDDPDLIWKSGNIIAGNETICQKLFELA